MLLLGPTASGKSALALALAEHIDAELISVDSAQIYRGMDIGTAKPSRAEQQQVPHHLLDILDPEATWSAADFAERATGLIAEIHQRGRVPLLVGGTMLYFRALIQGIDAMPEVVPEIRAQLRERIQAEGSEALHRELQAVDPIAADRIRASDPQRILRALEIFFSSGQRLSALQTGFRQTLPDAWQAFALWPEDRKKLHTQIAQRFDAMLDSGFAGELQRLVARPLLTAEHMSQRAVGYRQGWQWLAGEFDADEFRQRSIFATRQLAKRQLTWLRSMSWVTLLPAETCSAREVLTRWRYRSVSQC